MVQRADLVIIGVSVGLAAGLLIACLVLFGIYRYKRRSHHVRFTSDRSVATLPIRTNGLNTTSIDSSADFGSPVNINGVENLAQKPQHSWWNGHSKDRFTSASGIPRYYYKDIQKGIQNFTTILGQGSFGPVYKAVMPGGGVAAVKVLASYSKQGEKEFYTEVSLLARLHHRNLVNLIGYCVDKGQRMLVYEYMSNGSLENLIYSKSKNLSKICRIDCLECITVVFYLYSDNEEGALSWEDRLQIALDISHGIEYLHDGAVPPVIHRDLKSANILLDHSMRAKVADFGLSKEENFDGHNSGLKGTYGYIDPVYISTSKFTTKSDVYSFGVILFELITAIHPHQNLMEYVNLAALSPEGVDDIIDSKIVEKCYVDEVRSLAKIAQRCLHKTPRKRPLIGEVSQGILKIKQRRMAKEDTMSFASGDFSRAASRIEFQQFELRKMASIDERQNE